DDDRQHHQGRGGVACQQFLIGLAGPIGGKAGRQRGVDDVLQGRHGLARRESRRGGAHDLDRRVAVGGGQRLRPQSPVRFDDARQRHHVVGTDRGVGDRRVNLGQIAGSIVRLRGGAFGGGRRWGSGRTRVCSSIAYAAGGIHVLKGVGIAAV